MSYVIATERVGDNHRQERAVYNDRRLAVSDARALAASHRELRYFVVPADSFSAWVNHQGARGVVQVAVDSGWER